MAEVPPTERVDEFPPCHPNAQGGSRERSTITVTAHTEAHTYTHLPPTPHTRTYGQEEGGGGGGRRGADTAVKKFRNQ